MSKKETFPDLKDNYFDTGDEVTTPDSGVDEAFDALVPEQKAKQEAEWREQLEKTEDEIITLRQVLSAKVRESQELKRKLGVTPWKEFKDEFDQGIRVVRETEIVQKTETVVKSVAEKTSNVIGAIGTTVSKKLGDVRNSESFKSLEESVNSAYENVKEKVSRSRSSSVQNFEEAVISSDIKSSMETPMSDVKLPK